MHKIWGVMGLVGMVGFGVFAGLAQAQEMDVVATGVVAQPKVIRGQQVVTIPVGEAIREGDILVTDQESSADVAWESIWDCRVAPNSIMSVQRVSLESMAVEVLSGEVLFRIKEPLPASGRLEVFTPGAVVGVRGTEFSARIRVEQLNAVSTFAVHEGELEVRRVEDSTTVKVRANESVDIEWRSPEPYEKVKLIQKMIA